MKERDTKRIQKKAPRNLVNHASDRTDRSIQKIADGKARVEQMLVSGELASSIYGAGKKELEQAAFMELCGLGPNFLNGRKHKQTTKPDVVVFLQTVNSRLPASLRLPGDSSDKLSSEAHWRMKYLRLKTSHEELKTTLAEFELSYDRLATRAHHWWLDLRHARKENRVLKAKSGVKVVSILR